jgi:uncharacterized protein (DUF2267 family)
LALQVQHPDLINIVEREARLSEKDAERAVRATLHTLGERLSGGEARDLAEQLPEWAAAEVIDGEPAQPFDLNEFLHRIAEREGVDEDEARKHAHAVFTALGFVVEPAELRDVSAQLGKDYAPLMSAALHPTVPPPVNTPVPTHSWTAEKIVERVAERGGTDEDAARRAIDATLETLAERISNGQAEDIRGWLPHELREPIDRVLQRKGEQPEAFSLDEFLKRVAEREGVTRDEARVHARAVLSTLREALSPKEFLDTLAQLPRELRDLF